MSELIDNRARRIDTLKNIILRLHRGAPPEAVRGQLARLVGEVDSTEIAAMEQQLMAEGMTVREVQSMCDLHAQVLRDITMTRSVPGGVDPGHPVDTFRRENQALGDTIAAVRTHLAELAAAPDLTAARAGLDACRAQVHLLFDVDRHYQRKEHLLFSCLERHGITGPSKVMWAKDDEVRTRVKAAAAALASLDPADADALAVAAVRVDEALRSVEDMIAKEERILLPMALDTLTADEWGEIWYSSPRYGWCLVEPRVGYRPPETAGPVEPIDVPEGREIRFSTGHATFEQLAAIFRTLPVDLTFVDANDRVAFYTEGPDRVFARSRAIIGREVQHCHPPRSVSTVDRILDDFRHGRQEVAEFWIDFRGRFVHIRYFAVRSETGEYLGCLEVTQDVTAIRALQGERRLLQYDSPEEVGAPARSSANAFRPTASADC